MRINQSAQWLPELLGWEGKLFECRLAAAADYVVSRGEVSSLLHYTRGNEYKPHLDCINQEIAGSPQGLAEGGQRTTTLLLSLSDAEYAGGETYFPHLDAAARAGPGEILRFNNVDAEGRPLTTSLHAGRPVTSGEKWLLSKWVRESQTPFGRELSIDDSACV